LETKKWETDVKIFVKGKKVDYLIKELNNIVSELNLIINPINLKVVNSENDANMIVFFGSEKEFKLIEPYSKK